MDGSDIDHSLPFSFRISYEEYLPSHKDQQRRNLRERNLHELEL